MPRPTRRFPVRQTYPTPPMPLRPLPDVPYPTVPLLRSPHQPRPTTLTPTWPLQSRHRSPTIRAFTSRRTPTPAYTGQCDYPRRLHAVLPLPSLGSPRQAFPTTLRRPSRAAASPRSPSPTTRTYPSRPVAIPLAALPTDPPWTHLVCPSPGRRTPPLSSPTTRPYPSLAASIRADPLPARPRLPCPTYLTTPTLPKPRLRRRTESAPVVSARPPTTRPEAKLPSPCRRRATILPMSEPRRCARATCRNPVEPGRRLYCSDACAYSVARDRLKVRKAVVGVVQKVRRFPVNSAR